MCFAISINVWFCITVMFSEGNFVHYVNMYCALLLVEYMMSTRECLSEVKLSFFVGIVVVVFLVLYWVKLRTMSCYVGKGF